MTESKYNSCRICGLDAEVGYVSPTTGLCNVCASYEEHKYRIE